MRSEYNIQFKKLIEILNLGKLISEPKRIYGGLLHRMFYLKTVNGDYAVKALNPEIMKRPEALNHYKYSEKISLVAKTNINASTAKRFDGEYLIELEGQFYIVFQWVEGKSIKGNEINEEHCEIIGRILGKIHKTDFSEIKEVKLETGEFLNIEWKKYSDIKVIEDNMEKLKVWNEITRRSIKNLADNQIITHRDFDPKNVLWDEGKAIVVDWESAGYINPAQDLIETAFYWSTKENGNIDEKRFLKFVEAYQNVNSIVEYDWKDAVGAGFAGKLGWLEYSLKRALGMINGDEKEREIGLEQVISTMKELFDYESETEKMKILLREF